MTVAENRALKPIDSVRQALERMAPQLQMALPQHVTPERMIRIALTAVQQTPELLNCDRKSLYGAVMTAAQLGLEPSGVLGQGYLVPFRGRVQFIAGYRGLIDLARRSGDVVSIHAHEVREKDTFSYAYGTNEHLNHVPAEGDRGEITHFYAYARFTSGGSHFEVMTRADVEAIRDQSPSSRGATSPWRSHFVEMGRKTAIRRIAKYLPMSVQRAAALDEAADRGQYAFTNTQGDVEVIDIPDEDIEAVDGSALDAFAADEDDDSPPDDEKSSPSGGKKQYLLELAAEAGMDETKVESVLAAIGPECSLDTLTADEEAQLLKVIESRKAQATKKKGSR